MDLVLNIYNGIVCAIAAIYTSPFGRGRIKNKLKKKIWIIDLIILIISISIIGIGVIENVNNKEYDGVTISPTNSIVLGGVKQEYTIIITNNFPFPVYNLSVYANLLEGKLDMSNCSLIPKHSPDQGNSDNPLQFFMLYGPKINILFINEIEARSSYKLLMKINSEKFSDVSKIGYQVHYREKPLPTYSQPIKPNSDGKYKLPDTIKAPDGINEVLK